MCYIGEQKETLYVEPLELPCAMPGREVEPEPEQEPVVPVTIPVTVPV